MIKRNLLIPSASTAAPTWTSGRAIFILPYPNISLSPWISELSVIKLSYLSNKRHTSHAE